MTREEAIQICKEVRHCLWIADEQKTTTIWDKGAVSEAMLMAIEALKQVIGKLNNPDDSLLTADSEACKEQKSKLDLISRQDAIAEFRDGRDVYDIMESIEALPSVQPTGDLISRQDAIDALMNDSDWADAIPTIKSLPSAPDSRQRGEWVRLEREENVYDLHGVPTWGVNYMCDKCGFITTAIQDHFAQYRWCPSCGARMYKGGEEE